MATVPPNQYPHFVFIGSLCCMFRGLLWGHCLPLLLEMSVPLLWPGITTASGVLLSLSSLSSSLPLESPRILKARGENPRPTAMMSFLLLEEPTHLGCAYPGPSHPTGVVSLESPPFLSMLPALWTLNTPRPPSHTPPAPPCKNPWMSPPGGVRKSYSYRDLVRSELALHSVQILGVVFSLKQCF